MKKIFSLFLLILLINTVSAQAKAFGATRFYAFQQTKKTLKSKKRKKIIAKKVMSKRKLTSIASGAWGGDGIALVIEGGVVKIEYDCAEGEINQKLVTDEDGKFNVEGFHKRQTPALRIDLIPKPQAANFQGKISGTTMNLTVTIVETEQIIGEFTLTRDKAPRIRKCR